ncbi:MAG: cell division protein SepF [Candidatus Altiarchaeota archaeon]|nr:cell division protein SepF [Candidatus Altiarchaeota archaeon]
MGIKSWLGFEEGGEKAVDLEDYMDGIGLHNGELLDEDKFTYIKSIIANSPDVISDIERELKRGNIVILETEPVSQGGRLTLKKLINDMKALEQEIDGDMGRISESKIIVVPNGFRILKRRAE